MRLGIERVQLTKRIESLKKQEGHDEDADIPNDSVKAAEEALQSKTHTAPKAPTEGKVSLRSRAARGDIFRAVVLAKVREIKQQREAEQAEKDAASSSAHVSASGSRAHR